MNISLPHQQKTSGISGSNRAGYAFRASLKILFLIGAFFMLSFASHSQAALLISFEQDEGFALGSVNGQVGWTGPAGANTMSVSNAEAANGVWSLAVPAGTSRADSPDLSASKFTSLSYEVKAVGSTPSGIYSRIRILLNDDSTRPLEFNIRRNGANYQISYWTWDNSDVRTTTWVNLTSFSPFNWNKISFELASDGQTYSLSVNDSLIAGSLQLPTTITAAAVISQIQIFNHASGDFTGTAYYDTITAAVPEPTTSALLLIVIAAGVFRRMMKSQ